MNEIKVSAIVSTYNSEKFIKGCLEDLLQQTLYKKGGLEIVIVNSNSQENEEEIINEYLNSYSNIRYIKTDERETLYKAWNRGIQAAAGEYITNANTDDRHKKDAFEILSKELDSHQDIHLVYSDVLITDIEQETFENNTAESYYKFPECSLRQALTRQFFGPQPMWRKSVHEKIGYFDTSLVVAGDYDFFIRLVKEFKGKHIPEILGLYTRRSNSVERSNRDKNVIEENEVVSHFRKICKIEEVYPELKHFKNDNVAYAAALADFGKICFLSIPNYKISIKLYEEAIKLNENSLEILNNVGVLFWYSDQRENAIEIFKTLSQSLKIAADNYQSTQNKNNSNINLFFAEISHPVLEKMPRIAIGSLEEKLNISTHSSNISENNYYVVKGYFEKALSAVYSGSYNEIEEYRENYQNNIDYNLFESIDKRINSRPKLSVIIVTYNVGEKLIENIKSLEKQKFTDFETIVVDNGKNESVVNEILEYALLYIKAPFNLMPSEGRNVGVHFSNSEIVAFLDDDAIADENFTDSIMNAFQEYEIKGLRGKVVPKSSNKNNNLAVHYDLGNYPFYVTADTEGNSAFLKNVYLEVGGMNPFLFGGEGLEISYKIKLKYGDEGIIYSPDTIIFHDFAGTDEKLDSKNSRHQIMKTYLLNLFPDIYNYHINSMASRKSPVKKYTNISSKTETNLNDDSFSCSPFISICIPTYNQAHLIKDGINSALNQTYRNIEIIVVDDGSEDNTRRVVEEFNSSIIKYFLKEHTNAADTRNRAIKEASGEFIFWLDSDDIMDNRMVEEYIKEFNKYPDADIFYSNLKCVDLTGKFIHHFEYEDYYNKNDKMIQFLFKGQPIPNPGTMINKKVFKSIGLFNTEFKRAHDYEYFTRLVLQNKFKAKLVNQLMYTYRIHENNITLNTSGKINYEYERRIFTSLISENSLKLFFPDIDWNTNPAAAKSLAHLKIALRYYELEGYDETNNYLMKFFETDRNEKNFLDIINKFVNDGNFLQAQKLINNLNGISKYFPNLPQIKSIINKAVIEAENKNSATN